MYAPNVIAMNVWTKALTLSPTNDYFNDLFMFLVNLLTIRSIKNCEKCNSNSHIWEDETSKRLAFLLD